MDESPQDAIEDAEVVDDSAAVAIPAAVPPVLPEPDYTEGGVPTFDYVRDQIESRFTTSLGAGELAKDTPQGSSIEEQFTAREQAGKDRLEQIRQLMRQEKPSDNG
jgi:hypothetical protein